MTKSEQLISDLEKVLSGKPWYGPSVYTILERVSFEAAYEKPPGSVHNIAGIVLHMLAWTEEVLDRMNGLNAQLPSSGDWPDPGEPDEQKWQNYVSDLKLVTLNLLQVIRNFPDEQWSEPINDKQNREPAANVSFEEQVKGLI